MATNAYLILGVPRDANFPQVRRAYRRLAREHQPDRAGGDAERFAAIGDAYDTLADPGHRADHDRALAASSAATAAGDVAPVRDAPPIDLFASFATHRPSPDAIAAHWLQNFTGLGVPKSQHVRELTVELVLAPSEAARGGSMPMHVPVAHVCPRCAGTGAAGFYACDLCDGHGMEWDVARVDVLIPAGVADGASMPISLRHLGVRNLYLNVRVRVAS